MFVEKSITNAPANAQVLMRLPPSDLTEPQYRSPLLDFVANQACACVAQALMAHFSISHTELTQTVPS